MKMKTIAVLSALMTVILSGCGTGDNKEDASSAVQSKSVDTAVSSEVLEVTESAVETEESYYDDQQGGGAGYTRPGEQFQPYGGPTPPPFGFNPGGTVGFDGSGSDGNKGGTIGM